MIEITLRCGHDSCPRTLAAAWPDGEYFHVRDEGNTILVLLDGDVTIPGDGWHIEDGLLRCPEHADA